jgi:hypothetical protein
MDRAAIRTWRTWICRGWPAVWPPKRRLHPLSSSRAGKGAGACAVAGGTAKAERAITDALQNSPQNPVRSPERSAPFAERGAASSGLPALQLEAAVVLFRRTVATTSHRHTTPPKKTSAHTTGPRIRLCGPSILAAKSVMVASALDYRDGRMRGFGYCGAQGRGPRRAADKLLGTSDWKVTSLSRRRRGCCVQAPCPRR